jgi:phage shock protein PspC (stress-responsive transcriptional regulator)
MSDRLYRSRDDRMLAGVAGGLAEMWDADPSLVRIVWALLVVLTGGIALVVYIVMAIVVPEGDDPYRSPYAPGSAVPQPPPASDAMPGTVPAGDVAPPSTPMDPALGWVPPVDQRTARAQAREARRAARRAYRAQRGPGVGPVLIGALLVLLGVYFLVREYVPTIDWDWFWPLVLVGLGVVVLILAIDRNPRDEPPPGGPGAVG